MSNFTKGKLSHTTRIGDDRVDHTYWLNPTVDCSKEKEDMRKIVWDHWQGTLLYLSQWKCKMPFKKEKIGFYKGPKRLACAWCLSSLF